MPETPDFDAIIDRCFEECDPQRPHDIYPAPFVEALRQVWNARGAADIAKIDEIYSYASWNAMERALRSLDR